MDYQGGITIVSGASTVVAGVAVLPNTSGSNLMTVLTIGAIVTGCTAVLVQLVVSIGRAINR